MDTFITPNINSITKQGYANPRRDDKIFDFQLKLLISLTISRQEKKRLHKERCKQ